MNEYKVKAVGYIGALTEEEVYDFIVGVIPNVDAIKKMTINRLTLLGTDDQGNNRYEFKVVTVIEVKAEMESKAVLRIKELLNLGDYWNYILVD